MILDWMPEDVRMFDPDPEKTGIRRMQEILALVAPSKAKIPVREEAADVDELE